jgi:hypothetical protein
MGNRWVIQEDQLQELIEHGITHTEERRGRI